MQEINIIKQWIMKHLMVMIGLFILLLLLQSYQYFHYHYIPFYHHVIRYHIL